MVRIVWDVPIVDLVTLSLAMIQLGIAIWVALNVHKIHGHTQELSKQANAQQADAQQGPDPDDYEDILKVLGT